MAFKLLALLLVTALIAVNIIFAQEQSDQTSDLPSFDGGSDYSEIPIIAGFPSISNLPFFGSGQQLSFYGSRQERSADDREATARIFDGDIVACNYTDDSLRSCSSCRQTLVCFPNNVGRLHTCRGITRYCNNGLCSIIPGPQCINGTAP